MCPNHQDDSKHLSCDYLIVGAGTATLSFVDTLLDELPNATFILVDRFSRPGGHWTTAYPFVRLHQQSASYGVNSHCLGKNLTRKGFERFDNSDRATGREVCEYFAKVVEAFKATKRVQVYFNTEYKWNNDSNNHELMSSDGKDYHIVTCKKIVRSETRVVVPSMRKVPFSVDSSVSVVPINEIPENLEGGTYRKYVILGAGKSGTDAVLYLLASGVDQSAITWVISRDVWYVLRDGMFPEACPGKKYLQIMSKKAYNPLFGASDADDFFLRLEKEETVGRLDSNGPNPEVFKGAFISKSELEQLRKVKDIVRLGRVTAISSDQIILDKGTVPLSPVETLVVDCMAQDFYGHHTDFDDDFEIFNTDRIRLGPLSLLFNPSGTSAITAFLEAHFSDDAIKNKFLYFPKASEGMNMKEFFLLHMYYHLKTVDQMTKYKPALYFFLNSRTNTDSPLHHGGILPFLWGSFGPLQIVKKSKVFVKRVEDGDVRLMKASIPVVTKDLSVHEIKRGLREYKNRTRKKDLSHSIRLFIVYPLMLLLLTYTLTGFQTWA